MIEESPEAFIARWAEHAAYVQLFPHTEGSPLLEARAGNAVVQLFERTGPYLARPGPARVIIHAVTEEVERLARGGAEPGIEVTGLSRFEAQGEVVAVHAPLAVIDAGVPLVVAVLNERGAPLAVGDVVRFRNEPPAHGFVLEGEGRRQPAPGQEHHDDTI